MTLTAMPETTELFGLLKRVWGYDAFRNLQAEAIETVLTRRDSVVVLPTGGGKSLCYQLPALAMPGMAVVVSPLIALIKDQVDSLRSNGVAAAGLSHLMDSEERRAVIAGARARELKLLYLAPESLTNSDGGTSEFLRSLFAEAGVSFFAIDEAHCISHWGHEYRPAYRALGRLREWFPNVALHAFTATATEAVRADIAANLGMRDARILVGPFDRPNLTYRTAYRRPGDAQVREVIDRHPGEAGIIYCIRKKEVDALAASLARSGVRALPYHADLPGHVRKAHQEAFTSESIDVIVATVAFGMGIDRSDIRYVLHTGMPKAIESYQQESGRAGRDGLGAECVLLYSAGDAQLWRRMTTEGNPDYVRAARRRIDEMYAFCQTFTCRHRFLVNYFGQEYESDRCGACDVCLAEKEALDESSEVARRLLEGVLAVRERYGAAYVAQVLKGSKQSKIVENRHDELASYGALKRYEAADISDWLEQLASQGLLERGEFNVLKLTEAGRASLDGQGVQLARPRAKKASMRTVSLAGPDEEIFQALRGWRRQMAQERGVPAYLVLNDQTLLDLSRHRPRTHAELLAIRGIGQAKAADIGDRLLAFLRAAGPADRPRRDAIAPGAAGSSAFADAALSRARDGGPLREGGDRSPEAPRAPESPMRFRPAPAESSAKPQSQTARESLALFRGGLPPEAIAERRGLATSTILGHLAAFVADGAVGIDEIVPAPMATRIREGMALLGSEANPTALWFLMPPEVDYGHLLAIAAHLRREGGLIEPVPGPLGDRLSWLVNVGLAPSAEDLDQAIADLGSDDPRVRSVAAFALGKLATPVAVDALIARLDEEGDPLAWLGLVRGLGVARDPRAVTALEGRLSKCDPASAGIVSRVVRRLGA